MVPLILAVIFNSVYIQIFKKVTCAVKPKAQIYVPYGLSAFIGALLYALFSGSIFLSPQTFIAGLVCGICIYATLFFIFYALSEERSGIVWTIQSVNVLIPVGASIFIWGEKSTFIQLIGLAFVLLGVVGVAWKKNTATTSIPRNNLIGILYAIAACAGSGIVGMCWKYMDVSGLGKEIGGFIAVSFFVVFLISTCGTVSLGWPKRPEWGWGCLLGISHLSAIIYSIYAVLVVSGPVVFPIMVGAPLVLTMMAAGLFWKERFSGLELTAIASCIIGVVCLTVSI